MAISVPSSGLTNRRQSARAKARAKPGQPSGRPVYVYICRVIASHRESFRAWSVKYS